MADVWLKASGMPSPNELPPSDAPRVQTVTMFRVRHCIGDGDEGDPFREVDDYYTEDGAFFCRKEPA